MLLHHSSDARAAIPIASREAREAGQERISVRHLLIGLSQCGGFASELLERLGLSADSIRNFYANSNYDFEPIAPIIELAITEAKKRFHVELNATHLLHAVLNSNTESIGRLLTTNGLTSSNIIETIESQFPEPEMSLEEVLDDNSDDAAVAKLKSEIEKAQTNIESSIENGDFETAARFRDAKRENIELLINRLNEIVKQQNAELDSE